MYSIFWLSLSIFCKVNISKHECADFKPTSILIDEKFYENYKLYKYFLEFVTKEIALYVFGRN